MCMSICQGCPANWKANTDTPPITVTAKIRRVESPFPDMRHDTVAASAIATMKTAGHSQSAPRNKPTVTQIGTCSQTTASNALLVVSRRISSSLLSMVISGPSPLSCKAGGDRLRIHGKPDTGFAQLCQPIAVVRPNHQNGRNRRYPDDRGISGSGRLKDLLRIPPRWEGHGHHFGAGTDSQGKGCNRDEGRNQQCGGVQPRRPSRHCYASYLLHPGRISRRS